MDMLNSADISLKSDWFPDNVDFSHGSFGFVQANREVLSQQSFLDNRWDRTRLARVNVPIADVVSATGHQPRPQVNFIWHTAFCCSTLLARCLDVPGKNTSVKEPQILVQWAEAKRASGLAQHAAIFDATLKLLALPRGQNESVLVKPSNAVNTLLPDALRATNGRMLLLYSDCKSFLISIAKKGELGRIFARKLFSLFAADGHHSAKWPTRDLFELSDLQIAALVWHMQIAQLRRSKDLSRTAVLDCEDFLLHPASVLAALNNFFALQLSKEQIEEIATGPLLSRNAKNQTEPFNALRRTREANEIAQAFGVELDTVVDWSYRACPDTPREKPLGPTLRSNA